jgi:hypothetical protein
VQNVNDARVRKIIEKHVLKPLMGQSPFQIVQKDVDESMRVSKAFLTSYFSLYVTNLKRQEMLEAEERRQAMMRSADRKPGTDMPAAQTPSALKEQTDDQDSAP